MSTSVHSVFHLIFVIWYFVLLFLNIYGRKMRFSEGSQNSISEKSIFGNFEIKFFNVQIFLGGAVFPVSIIKNEYFLANMSSLVGLKKSYWFSREGTDFGHFWRPRSTFKVDLLNVQAKFGNILVQFPRRCC